MLSIGERAGYCLYERYDDVDPKLQRSVALLPWRHNLLLLEKITDDKEPWYYAEKAINLGWTRDILLNYIKADAFNNEKHLPKSPNFSEALPEILAEQAGEMLKSSYNLGFLELTQSVKEKELEQRLIEKIKHFVLELGCGFTFIGRKPNTDLRTVRATHERCDKAT